MSDWRPRLIASDMDGTLLRSDDTVSDATVAELERWRAAGVPVVLATGRPPRWMQKIREVLGSGTAVCCNGAVLLDLERFEVLEEDALPPDVLRAITAGLRREQPGTWFAVEYGLEFRHEPVYRPRWDVDAPGVAEAPLEELVAAPAAKLLARHEDLDRDSFVALVQRVVGDLATVTTSSSDALAEISAPGVTKATGLARVAATHGLGPEDVVVFGDMPNDVAAFDWVREGGGRAVAMAQAHPEVLAAATDVTGTNDDDGVAAFLATL
ncbi:Cof subfamily protein (haloacid dehalogenase superfamily) [Geodermatophilus bullaregiensis]|uniref:HAD family hydrolase n=1 Tax=Geodermatophilus bullaregiensis TaxID=1564160 RepID=UPI0019595D5A|nr:Cof-type HAD-IIB family hydrolase [Geodermatophilus bullaregiensis]MBM7806902.1 Cof subfamily protein (haloacid dehalogenase superfamily) [Geodermatophilus bullaregiensis]